MQSRDCQRHCVCRQHLLESLESMRPTPAVPFCSSLSPCGHSRPYWNNTLTPPGKLLLLVNVNKLLTVRKGLDHFKKNGFIKCVPVQVLYLTRRASCCSHDDAVTSPMLATTIGTAGIAPHGASLPENPRSQPLTKRSTCNLISDLIQPNKNVTSPGMSAS